MQILHQLASAVPDSYAETSFVQSMEFWVLLIAAGVLVLEWLASRR